MGGVIQSIFSFHLVSKCCSEIETGIFQRQVQSSAVVGLMFRAFRDALLHTLVVTSDCLNYCCLHISSKQSGHSPLTSDINRAFSARGLMLAGYFPLFWIILCKPQRWLCEETPRRSAVSEKLFHV